MPRWHHRHNLRHLTPRLNSLFTRPPLRQSHSSRHRWPIVAPCDRRPGFDASYFVSLLNEAARLFVDVNKTIVFAGDDNDRQRKFVVGLRRNRTAAGIIMAASAALARICDGRTANAFGKLWNLCGTGRGPIAFAAWPATIPERGWVIEYKRRYRRAPEWRGLIGPAHRRVPLGNNTPKPVPKLARMLGALRQERLRLTLPRNVPKLPHAEHRAERAPP